MKKVTLTQGKIYFLWIPSYICCNFTLGYSNFLLTRSNFSFPSDHFYITLPSITRTMFWALCNLKQKKKAYRSPKHWALYRNQALFFNSFFIKSKFFLLPLKSASYLHCIPSPSPTLTTLTYQSPSLLLKKKKNFLWTQDNSYFFRFPREGYFRVIGSRLYFLRAAIGCKYGEFAIKTEIAKFLILSQKKPLREIAENYTISKALGKKSGYYKGSTFSSVILRDPKCWSGRGLNLRPPAQQTGALPTELTGRRWCFVVVFHTKTPKWYHFVFSSVSLLYLPWQLLNWLDVLKKRSRKMLRKSAIDLSLFWRQWPLCLIYGFRLLKIFKFRLTSD